VAILVGVQCGATLYAIRLGRLHHSIWADGFARTQERGLLLCVACVIVGLGLWTLHRWSRWIEALLFVPKLYCAYPMLARRRHLRDLSNDSVAAVTRVDGCLGNDPLEIMV
jgi:hypothetical protein